MVLPGKLKTTLCLLLVCMLAFIAFTSCTKSSEQGKVAKSETKVEWPTSTVQFVIPTAAGLSTDTNARLIVQYLQETTKQNFAVLNQGTASGAVAYETVKNAKPDGTTLLIAHGSMLCSYYTGTINNPASDYTVIAALHDKGSLVFTVAAKSSYQTLRDVIDDALANPGKLIAGVNTNAETHFIMGKLMKQTGAKFKLVEAPQPADKLSAQLGGYMALAQHSMSSGRQYEEAGDLRILGLTSPKKDERFPKYTPVSEQGFDGVDWTSRFFVLGPKNMDPLLVEAINAAFAGLTENATFVERVNKIGGIPGYFDVATSQKMWTDEDKAIAAVATDLGINVRQSFLYRD